MIAQDNLVALSPGPSPLRRGLVPTLCTNSVYQASPRGGGGGGGGLETRLGNPVAVGLSQVHYPETSITSGINKVING